MKSKRIFLASMTLAIFAVAVLCASAAQAQTFKILHSFGAFGDGAQPISGLVADRQGNLYGQTSAGGGGDAFCGAGGCGTVFELTPNSDGTWSEAILHRFIGPDGAGASFEPPVFDSRGNLYGTTGNGGSHSLGTVFQLTPLGDGKWAFSSLYSFANGSDGWGPSGIVFHNGMVYATASWGGGQNDEGAVINLSQSSPNHWSELSLHDFNEYNDGWLPEGLVFDPSGNAYGTTFYGGPNQNLGTVYKMTQDPVSRRWTETIIHEFETLDGNNPSAPLVFDSSGNLYSTTIGGGRRGGGNVFELMPNSDGTWSFKTIYSFYPGELSYAGVAFDQQGNLYAITEGSGRVYKLTPSSGEWTATILHQFNGSDGAYPFASVILDSAGNIYGTTQLGGQYGKGVAFEVSP